MTFLKTYWLGLAVLLCLAGLGLAQIFGWPIIAIVWGVLFWVFFAPWLIRTFVRLVSKAWHHGT
jgi:hypothetical protein